MVDMGNGYAHGNYGYLDPITLLMKKLDAFEKETEEKFAAIETGITEANDQNAINLGDITTLQSSVTTNATDIAAVDPAANAALIVPVDERIVAAEAAIATLIDDVDSN